MKMYKALVKDKETKNMITIESECKSISEFRRQLKNNDYSIVNGRIASKEKYDYILENTNGDSEYFKYRLNTIKSMVNKNSNLTIGTMKALNLI